MTNVQPNQDPSLLQAPKVMLQGDSGTGKTTSLKTLEGTGVMPFVLFLEQGREVLGPTAGTKYHFRYIRPQVTNWDQLAKMMKVINTMSFEGLTKVTDSEKQKYVGLYDVVTSCNDFKCDCCGKSWGDVSLWNTDRALVVDGLSGLSDMAMQLVVGIKPVRSQADWGVAQNTIKFLLGPMTNMRAMFILIAHLAREENEVTGGTNIVASTLGKKLAPDLPRMFSDVIQAERNGVQFTWSTATVGSAVKGRNLPIKSGLEPSFRPLLEQWKANGGKIEETKP